MEKLTSNSIYCDYNSTSPLSSSVINFLGNGDFMYANPSSVHQLGKKSKKAIREVSEYITSLYSFNSNEKFCVFQSGATEGLNSLILGLTFQHVLTNKKRMSFFYSPLDHSCIVNLCPLLNKLGVQTFELPIDVTGALDVEKAIDFIKNVKSDQLVMSYTWVNNETGMAQALEDAVKIKRQTNCIVVVDAVQSPGKVSNWKNLCPELDAYVFSAHKFGGMKGVGFTFISSDLDILPTLYGGGQQNGLRSGTENIIGIQSIQLAFNDLELITSSPNHFELRKMLLTELEDSICQLIDDKMMVSKNLNHRNVNTICFVSPDVKANVLMMAMDLNGLQVSSGSACSSGASLPGRILVKLGFSNEQAHGGIRLSFGPKFSRIEMEEVKKRLTLSLGKYYHK